MVIENIFEKYDFGDIVAYSGKDITDAMIDECFAIDRNFYDDEYSWENSEIRQIVKEFGQMCFVFFDKNDKKVMGYSFWLPVKTTVFNAFIKEKVMLLNIKKNYCEDYKNTSSVNLFLGGEAFVVGYDLKLFHKAIEDLFQKRVLDMAKAGIKIKYIAAESCCDYDEQFLVPKLKLEKKVKKDKSNFYYDEYSPKKVYSESKYAKELYEFYK
ncbi:MAG: hypothetical protein IJA23_00790 [Clostridia bacterium]|nr:hypothetical protein [Clostridia bacterium]